ncbi:hypothetical protein ACSEE7_05865 [Halomonas cupida]|uniref:hypothetical protein n=1 Tax=Halomonas cupida TaxID=44933 RepID=UPI003EFAC948
MGLRITLASREARPLLVSLLVGPVLFSPLGLAPAAAQDDGPATSAVASADEGPGIDPDSGFVMGEGWQTVKGNCTVCHSAALVTQNRGSRDHWAYLIDWMQETQGLWQFNPEMEDTILDYLSTYYGPRTDARRQNLPRHLMPPTAQASEHDSKD